MIKRLFEEWEKESISTELTTVDRSEGFSYPYGYHQSIFWKIPRTASLLQQTENVPLSILIVDDSKVQYKMIIKLFTGKNIRLYKELYIIHTCEINFRIKRTILFCV